MRTVLVGITALLFLGTLLAQAGWAGVYVCRDAHGNAHYTNVPESDSCRLFRAKQPTVFKHRKTSRSTRTGLVQRPYKGNVPYAAAIERISKRYHIDPNLIKAVIRTESDFNRYAVSRSGAQGLMQLMPDTARELRVQDPFNPYENIDGGTRYLRGLLNEFNGDLELSIAAYNAGPALVKRVRRIPHIPETQQYVKRVLTYYQDFAGGNAVALNQSLIRVRTLLTVQ